MHLVNCQAVIKSRELKAVLNSYKNILLTNTYDIKDNFYSYRNCMYAQVHKFRTFKCDL